jgi:hypothetical protein
MNNWQALREDALKAFYPPIRVLEKEQLSETNDRMSYVAGVASKCCTKS